jgi:hypothetical protein
VNPGLLVGLGVEADRARVDEDLDLEILKVKRRSDGAGSAAPIGRSSVVNAPIKSQHSPIVGPDAAIPVAPFARQRLLDLDHGDRQRRQPSHLPRTAKAKGSPGPQELDPAQQSGATLVADRALCAMPDGARLHPACVTSPATAAAELGGGGGTDFALRHGQAFRELRPSVVRGRWTVGKFFEPSR